MTWKNSVLPLLLTTIQAILSSNSETCYNEKNNNCQPPNQKYGVDVSFPIHHHTVSTNYPHPNNNVHIPDESMPIQPLGNKKALYEKFLQGCMDYYKDTSCQKTEEFRIESNRNQPSSQHNYTDTGYKILKVPTLLWELIIDFWRENRDSIIEEKFAHGYSFINHWDAPVHFIPVQNGSNIGGGSFLTRVIAKEVRDLIQDWTNTTLTTTSVYGIRIYNNGSILSPHVDRPSLISSAILNIDQDVDEAWPLEVYDRNGYARNITMAPRDMILYESHTLIHGRPFPFTGTFFANIFVHFEPSDWNEDTIIEFGTTHAHIAAREGNLHGLKIVSLYSDSNVFLERDRNGWMPIHEASRGGYVPIVQYLLENGCNVNEYTSVSEDGTGYVGGTPLYWALTVFDNTHPIVMFLRENGGLNVEPKLIQN